MFSAISPLPPPPPPPPPPQPPPARSGSPPLLTSAEEGSFDRSVGGCVCLVIFTGFCFLIFPPNFHDFFFSHSRLTPRQRGGCFVAKGLDWGNFGSIWAVRSVWRMGWTGRIRRFCGEREEVGGVR